MLDNALDQFLENDEFQYLIYSTADIVVPNNLFEILSKINKKNFCALSLSKYTYNKWKIKK